MAYSRAAITALIAANLIPLAGVFASDWNLYTLVMLYWSENIVIGAYTVTKMALAKRVGPVGKTKLYKTLLFAASYGTFVVLHGSVLSRLVFGSADREFMFGIAFAAAFAGFVASHGVSLGTSFYRGREHEKLSAFDLMFLPYPRVAPTHIVLIVAAIILLRLDEPRWMLAALVLLKILLDALFHVAEHSAVAKR